MQQTELLIQRVTDFSGIEQFECGITQMDNFLHEHLEDCSKSHYCTTYFVRFEHDGDIVALFSLSNDSVDIDSDDFEDMRIGASGTDLPLVDELFREQFEQKYTYPALEITYLAVSKKYQSMKIGSAIIDIIANMAREQKLSVCVFLTVKALVTKEYIALSFYEKNQFARLTSTPQFDVWPMYRTLWPCE